MIIVADAGSTKTDWRILEGTGDTVIRTSGINPAIMSESQICDILKKELRPQLAQSGILSERCNSGHRSDDIEIYYYGAGCSQQNVPKMKKLLQNIFGTGSKTEVESDLTAAGRSLFGRDKGIACILGTGSNSGLYDGNNITYKVPSMGYILGDEGSGAVLGKLFLNALYKGRLPEPLLKEFEEQCSTDIDDIIQNVYRRNTPSKFLASLSVFISSHIDVDGVADIVVSNFRSFFRNNTSQYNYPELEVGIVGSIACIYRTQLLEAAQAENVRIGCILQSPAERLVEYHKSEAVRP